MSLRGKAEAISMEMQYYVYIMTNKNDSVLYTGITNNLKRRVFEHKEKLVDGFTQKYNITKLVYYETLRDVSNAILREKQIKGGSRAKKIELINNIIESGKIYMKIFESLIKQEIASLTLAMTNHLIKEHK